MRVPREVLVFYFIVNVQHEPWPPAPVLLPAQPLVWLILLVARVRCSLPCCRCLPWRYTTALW
jgi:hypothetical protein